MDLREELEIDNPELTSRKVKNAFLLRSKYPNRHIIQSRAKRCPFRIIENGQDVTPRPHIIPGVTYMDDNETIESIKDILKHCWELFNKQGDTSVECHMSKESLLNMISFQGGMRRLEDWCPPDNLEEQERKTRLGRAPSRPREYHLKTSQYRDPKQYRARFKETPTVFFLDLMSRLAKVGSEELKKFEEEEKKILKREMKKPFIVRQTNEDKFTQMPLIVTRDESTTIASPKKDDAEVEANEFHRFKTFLDLKIIDSLPKTDLVSVGQKPHKPQNSLRKKEQFRLRMLEGNNRTPKELPWLESMQFMKSALFVERILSANVDSSLQATCINGMYSLNPVDDFKYIPKLLWTCSCPRTYDKPVTSISWSCLIKHLFVVSHGQYLSDEKKENGIVCVWNVKNTEFPERMCILPNPVTYVELSKKYPRIAGVGFWDGTVGLLDIALPEPEFLVKSDMSVGLLRPIWQTKWFQFDGNEIFIICGQNGQMHTFEINRKFRNRKLLTVQRVGNITRKGIDMPQIPPNYDKSLVSPAIMNMVQHPKTEHIFFVGTDQGYVHVFSLLKPEEALDVFGAHVGQITAIEFNPVDSRIFLTSGNDFHVRIWGYNMYETYLLQLKPNSLFGVESAAWYPAHPYMLVSLSGPKVDVWHLKRNYFEPVTTIENPSRNRNLVVSFDPNGADFLIGDIKGYVHVYTFTSIPKPPEDPLEILAKAIVFPLSYDDERLKLMISKLGPPFVPDEKKIKELFPSQKIK